MKLLFLKAFIIQFLMTLPIKTTKSLNAHNSTSQFHIMVCANNNQQSSVTAVFHSIRQVLL